MTTETIKVPDLGGADGVEVIEIPISVGDSIEEESTLLVLESDKATMDVPSPVAGKVSKILVKLGDTIGEGTAIVEVDIESETSAQKAEDAVDQSEDVEDDDGKGALRAEAEAPVKPSSSTQAPSSEKAQPSEKDVLLPDLGTDDEVEVIEIAIKEGVEFAEGDTLFTLEGDKATMEVPAPFDGVITSVLIAEGDKVKSGQKVAVAKVVSSAGFGGDEQSSIDDEPSETSFAGQPEASNSGKSSKPAEKADDNQSTQGSAVAPNSAELSEPEAPAKVVYAGPLVRKLARELGVDLRNVEGSGVKGRIQSDDVHAYVKKALAALEKGQSGGGSAGAGVPAVADVDFSRFGDVEEISLSKIDRLTAANMTKSWLNVPAVTQFDDADITEMEVFRKSLKADAEKKGVKLTPVAFIMLACARVLANHPVINRSWHSSGEKAIQKHYIHIGLAVDTPRGLMVPVVRNVDKKGLFDIAADIAELAEKARAGKLSSADMQGGCITISSLGAIGGKGFTPIVNTPETAIIGVSKASIQPVWNGEEFEPRQMLPLSLTYDHRLVNGADGGKFFTDVVAVLGDIRRLLL